MKYVFVLTASLASLFLLSTPVLSQNSASWQGTYKMQTWRHDLGRPALNKYKDSRVQSGKCLQEFEFKSGGKGSFKGSDCKSWTFQWQSKGRGSHEWITGVIPCERLEVKYDAGSSEFVCVDDAGVTRAGADRFGQAWAYTKKEI